MDYRILLDLYREAQRKELEKTLNMLSTYRAAQADKSNYKNIVNELKQRMNQIVVGAKETIKSNWSELKKRG